MKQNIFDNPFIKCTAKDMPYKELPDYWVSPFSLYDDLDETELLREKTPIFIEGIRGSGKTMVLKYISYYCQKNIVLKNSLKKGNKVDLFEYFKEKGSIGIYLRYKEDFTNMLPYLKCSDEYKKILFSCYFNWIISKEIILIIDDLFKLFDKKKNEKSYSRLTDNFSEYFSRKFSALEELVDFITKPILDLDECIKNSRYYENPEKELDRIIKTTKNNIISSVIKIIGNSVPQLKNTLFLIIIDEYESIKDLQKVINTYIKRVDDTENITYRIGMRTGGMSTYNTDIGDEFLQIDRDFLLKKLIPTSRKEYKNFLKKIIKKRLEQNVYFNKNGITDIETILGKSEDLEKEAFDLVQNSSFGPIKHFEYIKKTLSESLYNKALEKLRYPQNPLIEMMNIIWVLRERRRWRYLTNIEDIIEDTQEHMNKYIEGKSEKSDKYKRDYIDKYKYQLMCILASIYRAEKLYYSFNTFSFLSSGCIIDFIALCRNTFYQLDKSYFMNIERSPTISPYLQTKGAQKTALLEIGTVKANNENGLEMYTFAMNLGNCFSKFHKDLYAKYPETNQFAFEDDFSIDEQKDLKEYLKSMLKWGVIIKKQKIQSITIGRRKSSIYYLNRIFAPIFNISYRTRGGYNLILSKEDFYKMLNSTMKPQRIDTYMPWNNCSLGQLNLFEEETNDDQDI